MGITFLDYANKLHDRFHLSSKLICGFVQPIFEIHRDRKCRVIFLSIHVVVRKINK